jgi:hypothetical protein
MGGISMKMWVVRDKVGCLRLYMYDKPVKNLGNGFWESETDLDTNLEASMFPEVKWSDDEPTEVELVIKK